MIDRLLTPEDVAERLSIGVRTARNYMRRMVHSYVGKHLRVTSQALTAWLEKTKCAPVAEPERSRGHESAVQRERAAAARREAALRMPHPPLPTSSSAAQQIRLTQPRRRRPAET